MRALGLGLAMNKLGSPRFRGLLDKFGGAAAAYSLRALSSGWLAGDVVLVRRSSDSAQLGFTANEITNGTLTTWTGAGDGFVVTWYDQSGNGNDATQGTTTAQPKIVSAGALVVGGIDFDGVDDFMQSGANTTHDSVFMVNSKSTSASAVAFGSTIAAARYSLLNTSTISQVAGGVGFISYAETRDTAMHLDTALHSAGKLRKDGVERASGPVGANVGGDSLIGARIISAVPATFWIGTIAEIIVYATDQTANVAAIDAAIIANYPIP